MPYAGSGHNQFCFQAGKTGKKESAGKKENGKEGCGKAGKKSCFNSCNRFKKAKSFKTRKTCKKEIRAKTGEEKAGREEAFKEKTLTVFSRSAEIHSVTVF